MVKKEVEGNSTQETEEIPDKKKKVWRTCKYCSHKWLGVPTSNKCPKCNKNIGKVKKVADVPKAEVQVENVEGYLAPLPEAAVEVKEEKKEPEKKEVLEKEAITTPADIPADTYTNIAAYPFEVAANLSKRNYIRLTDKEKQTLAPLLKKVGDKWIGRWFEKYPEEAALALTFGMIIMGKIALEMQYRRSHKKEEEEDDFTKYYKSKKGLREQEVK